MSWEDIFKQMFRFVRYFLIWIQISRNFWNSPEAGFDVHLKAPNNSSVDPPTA